MRERDGNKLNECGVEKYECPDMQHRATNATIIGARVWARKPHSWGLPSARRHRS
jgi:hypothetical protein